MQEEEKAALGRSLTEMLLGFPWSNRACVDWASIAKFKAEQEGIRTIERNQKISEAWQENAMGGVGFRIFFGSPKIKQIDNLVNDDTISYMHMIV